MSDPRPAPSYILSGRRTSPMHSLEGPFGATFHYNSDLSGMVTLEPVDPREAPIHVAYEDLRALVLEMRRKRLITQLEDMDYDALDNL
jgi:hypothetical protein